MDWPASPPGGLAVLGYMVAALDHGQDIYLQPACLCMPSAPPARSWPEGRGSFVCQGHTISYEPPGCFGAALMGLLASKE